MRNKNLIEKNLFQLILLIDETWATVQFPKAFI